MENIIIFFASFIIFFFNCKWVLSSKTIVHLSYQLRISNCFSFISLTHPQGEVFKTTKFWPNIYLITLIH
jgi:hypothetical protein